MVSRALVVVAVLLAAPTASAQRPETAPLSQDYRVVVVPGLELADLERLESHGAIGLLVPAAGPETNGRQARAALARGKVRNSLRGGIPGGRDLISYVEEELTLPVSEPTIVVGLPTGPMQRNNRRYPIAVLGDRHQGLLVSDSTRIPGLVSIADIAPTALRVPEGLEWRPTEDAAADLLELDRRIRDNGRLKLPASLLVGLLVLALALARPRAGLLAVAVALAANLALGAAGVSSLWLVLAVFALSIAGSAAIVASNRLLPGRFGGSSRAVGGVGVAVVAAYLVAMAIDPTWVALSPLGPTQNSRFYGISNLLETMFLLPAFAGAAVLGERFGPVAFAAVVALALVMVAGNRFGADGGGAIVLAVGFTVLAAQLVRARGRTLALAIGGALALVVVLIAVDAATGGASHVTRSLSGGPAGVLSDLGDRIALSYARATSPWYIAPIVVAAVAALVVLVVRLLRESPQRPRRALLLAYAAAIGTSLVVNDSPSDVAVMGLIGFVVLERATTSAVARVEGGADDRRGALVHG